MERAETKKPNIRSLWTHIPDEHSNLLDERRDIDDVLARYVKNPKRFREEMMRCDAVIINALPVHLFAKSDYYEDSMDILTIDTIFPYGKLMVDYLLMLERYSSEVVAGVGSPYKDLEWTGALEITSATRELDGIERKVRVLSCKGTSVAEIVMGRSPLSLLCGIITCDKAYHVFPSMTFVRKEMECMNGPGSENTVWHERQKRFKDAEAKKWLERGWKEVKTTQTDREAWNKRLIGDEDTWIVGRKIDHQRVHVSSKTFVRGNGGWVLEQ